MTDKQLIAEAKKLVKSFGAHNGTGVPLAKLPIIRAVDAMVVYFGSNEHDGRIEVYLERETGKFIGATSVPCDPKKK